MKYNDKKVWRGLLYFVIVCVVIESYAKVRAIESVRDFNQRLAQQGICVVLFYDSGDRRDSLTRKKIKQLNYMFEEVGSTPTYDDADIIFAKVNVARKALGDIATKYDVKAFPTFMLFKDGRSCKNKSGRAAILSGFVGSEALKSFIERYCGKEIERLETVKNNEKTRRVSKEKSSWLPYFYPRDMFVESYDPAERLME